jgi:signal transduction histidine kinase/DNA-binding response OmpR family regulator
LLVIRCLTISNMLYKMHKINLWLENKLSYPGCTHKELFGHMSVWKNTITSFSSTLLITAGLLIFAPQLTLLIHYGYALMVLFSITMNLFLLFPSRFIVVGFSQGFTLNLITFYFILKLGGIPTSGGLIFVGLSVAIATVPLQMAWYSVMMFSIYLVLVTLMVALKPWLHVPEQMTPGLNSVMFMINTMTMAGSSLLFVLNFIRQQRLYDDLEAQKMKEISEAKNKLFTNITHEFRTPLTVIQGMADLIEKSPDDWIKEGTSRIRSNSNVLLRLVNQMLDLARIESGLLPVRMVRGNVNDFLVYITELFGSLARIREITLLNAIERESFEMDYDPDKLLQILSNLLSNAFKFTGKGGEVKVSSHGNTGDSFFTLTVSDTGTGIAPEHLPHIFERFYQAHAKSGDQPGTGLGLFYTRELVELLKGRITVRSIPDEGTEFTVVLPVTRNAPADNFPDSGKIEKQVVVYLPVSDGLPAASSGEITAGSGLPLMLIVEDSSDVSLYLGAILKDEYQIVYAENGKTGYEKAVAIIPDVILSDVMMPEMDGIDMLEKVKGDFRTSHIPVVMLTAKADVDSRLEGLSKGADAYLAKPFNEKELHIVLKNLVEIRRKLHERYSLMDRQPEPSAEEFRMEDAFMMKVRQKMEANLEDDEFGISSLCQELAVSRSQLYRKFKSLSNKTITDYFKSLRLHKARELLCASDLNVSEVTYAVGFKNLSHFSREFTREFGKSPSEFRVRI